MLYSCNYLSTVMIHSHLRAQFDRWSLSNSLLPDGFTAAKEKNLRYEGYSSQTVRVILATVPRRRYTHEGPTPRDELYGYGRNSCIVERNSSSTCMPRRAWSHRLTIPFGKPRVRVLRQYPARCWYNRSPKPSQDTSCIVIRTCPVSASYRWGSTLRNKW